MLFKLVKLLAVCSAASAAIAPIQADTIQPTNSTEFLPILPIIGIDIGSDAVLDRIKSACDKVLHQAAKKGYVGVCGKRKYIIPCQGHYERFTKDFDIGVDTLHVDAYFVKKSETSVFKFKTTDWNNVRAYGYDDHTYGASNGQTYRCITRTMEDWPCKRC